MSNQPIYHLFNAEYAKALVETIDKTVLYTERRERREYSILFHTPLHIAQTLPISYVLQNLYEHRLQERTKQQLASIISDFIPELGEAIEEENQEFMRQLQASITAKNQKKQEKKQSPIVEEEVKAPEINMTFPDEDPDFI